MQVSAQETLTLQQVLERIEQNNPGLKAYDRQVKSRQAKVAGAKSWMSPMVGIGTFMTPYPGASAADEDRGALMFTAEQDIPNPAKTRAKTEFLASQSAISETAKLSAFNDLRAAAKELYYDLLVAEKKIRYQKENRRIMQTMRKLAEIRYPLNQGGLNNVFKAEGRSYEAENMILMTESEIRSKKIALSALMFRSPMDSFRIDTSYKVAFMPEMSADTMYHATVHSDIRQMDLRIRSMSLDIKQMRQQAKPDFRIRFEHMANRSEMMPNQYTLMGMVSIPIAPWSSKMYKSDIRSMEFEIDAMALERQAMLNQMTGMSKSMETELLTMQKQLGNYESKILPALSKNLKVSMLSYQENKLELPMVIDSWETVNMAQMNYLDQLQKFYKMIVQYEKSIER
ncbi:TolC family protein [Flavihumibacter sp. R14]|nr:TolC family protein [Flavihumibacter soli]